MKLSPPNRLRHLVVAFIYALASYGAYWFAGQGWLGVFAMVLVAVLYLAVVPQMVAYANLWETQSDELERQYTWLDERLGEVGEQLRRARAVNAALDRQASGAQR